MSHSPDPAQAGEYRYNPPENEMAGAIAFAAVLGRTEDAVVAITGARAYSAGITVDIAIWLRRVDHANPNILNDVLFAGRRHGNTADALLLGVEYPDGRRTSILDKPWFPESGERPEQPSLMPAGGGGSSTSQQLAFWLHPLPPPGDLIIVTAWPWEPPVDAEPPPPPPRPEVAPGSWFADLPE